MTTDDRWMDEILNSSEKQEILAKIKEAIGQIEGLRVDDALEVLWSLHDELDEDVEKKEVKNFEQNLKSTVEDALRGHSHQWHQPHSHSHGLSDGTETGHSYNSMRDLFDEFQEMKGYMQELHHLYRQHLQGTVPLNTEQRRRLEVEAHQAVSRAVSGAVAVPAAIRIDRDEALIEFLRRGDE